MPVLAYLSTVSAVISSKVGHFFVPPPKRHLCQSRYCSSVVAPRASPPSLFPSPPEPASDTNAEPQTPRRWRAQLRSCRCYSSPAAVIQIAFLLEPPSCSSSLFRHLQLRPCSRAPTRIAVHKAPRPPHLICIVFVIDFVAPFKTREAAFKRNSFSILFAITGIAIASF